MQIALAMDAVNRGFGVLIAAVPPDTDPIGIGCVVCRCIAVQHPVGIVNPHEVLSLAGVEVSLGYIALFRHPLIEPALCLFPGECKGDYTVGMELSLQAAFQHHRAVTVQAAGRCCCFGGDNLSAAARAGVENGCLLFSLFLRRLLHDRLLAALSRFILLQLLLREGRTAERALKPLALR